MIYLALVSISSIAFATVTFKSESKSNSVSQIKRVTLSEPICLNPSYASNSDNVDLRNREKNSWLESVNGTQLDPRQDVSIDSSFDTPMNTYSEIPYDEQIKVQLTSYSGSIRRLDDTSVNVKSGADLDRPHSFWNPLAKVWLTAEQVQIMNIAFDIAYQDGGLHHAKLIQGMLLQETLAGLVGRIGHMSAPVGKRSYGVMQVKVTAATDVLAKYASLGKFNSDDDIITQLIVDDVFNIRVASKLFLHLRARTKTDDHALLAYNIGLRGSRRYSNHQTFRYVQKVNRYSRLIAKPFNEKFNGKAISKNRFSASKTKAS